MQKDSIRVICHLPEKVNRLLQAQASLENKSKQALIAEILVKYASSLKLEESI